MSTISGSAPKVYFNKDVAALDDVKAVKLLLNDRSGDNAALWPTTGADAVETDIGTNAKLTMTTAANKSLLDIRGERVSLAELGLSGKADNMEYIPADSWPVYPETYQYRLDTVPFKTYVINAGVSQTEADATLTNGVILEDMVPTSQADLDLQAEFRNVDLGSTNFGAPLGNLHTQSRWAEVDVQGKYGDVTTSTILAYGTESMLTGILRNATVMDASTPHTVAQKINATAEYKPHGTLAENNISVTYTRPSDSHTINASDLGIYKISWEDAEFNLSTTDATPADQLVRKEDGSAIPVNSNIAYSTYVAADYPVGNADAKIKVADYNALKSSTLSIEVSPIGGKTEPFSLVTAESSANGMVDISSDLLNMSTIGDQFPKGNVEIVVDNTHNLVADSTTNNSNLSVVLIDELLPAGKTASDATITFDSTQANRATTTSAFTATTTVKYDADSGVKPFGVLSNANMTTLEVCYDGDVVIPSTSNTANITSLVSDSSTISAKSNGMVFYMENALSPITIENVDEEKNNIVGKMYLINTLGNLDADENKAEDGTLVSTVDGIANYELSHGVGANNSYDGSDISGSINHLLIEGGGAASDGLRLKFTSLPTLEGLFVEQSSSNMLPGMGAAEVQRLREDSLILYDINDDTIGPAHLETIRASNSGNYKQKYTLQFPPNKTALSVQALSAASYKVNGKGVIYPYRVQLSASDDLDQELGRAIDLEVKVNSDMAADGYKYANFVIDGLTDVSDVSGVRTVNAVVIVPLTISGIVNSSAVVRIPVKYSYNLSGGLNGGPSYISDLVPTREAKLWITRRSLAFTHTVSIEGKNGSGQWTKIGSGASSSKDIDLRSFYDVDAGTQDISFGQSGVVNVQLKLSPRNDADAPSVYSINYTLSAAFKNLGMEILYMKMSQDLVLMSQYSLLNKNNLRAIIEAAPEREVTLKLLTTTMDTTDATKYSFTVDQNASNTDLIAFKATMNRNGMSTLYFARAYETLVRHNRVEGDEDASYYELLDNDEEFKVDDGISMKLANIRGASTIGQQAYDVCLNNDKYVATAYLGQTGNAWNTNGLIPTNLELIPDGQDAGAFPTSGITSTIYRGYKDGQIYSFHRPQTTMTVTWKTLLGSSIAALTQTLHFDAVAKNETLQKVADLSNSLGMKINLSFNSKVDQTYVFAANYCDVIVKFNGVNQLVTTTATCPFNIASEFNKDTKPLAWIEKFKLNNFFQAAASTTVLAYNQSDISIARSSNYISYDQNWTVNPTPPLAAAQYAALTFSNPESKDDETLSGSRNWTVSTFTLNFPDTALAHRTTAKHFIIGVVPMYARVFCLGKSNNVASEHFVSETVSTIPINEYKINVVVDTEGLEIKRALGFAGSWVLKTKLKRDRFLLSIRGLSGLPNIANDQYPNMDTAHMYVNQVPHTLTTRSWSQYGTLATGGVEHNVVMKFSLDSYRHPAPLTYYQYLSGSHDGLFLPRLFNSTVDKYPDEPEKIRWSNFVQVANTEYCRIYQYLLRFDLDTTTHAMVPVVYKFRSQLFDQTALGPVGDLSNVDAAGGTRDTFNSGHLKQIKLDVNNTATNAMKFVLDRVTDLALVRKLKLPYLCVGATNYPELDFVSGLTTVNFVAVPADEKPECLDLVINVRDYDINSNGDVVHDSSATNGTNQYLKLFNLRVGKARWLSIYNKDQLVVKNHVGQLSMRVGPDGQVYTSDLHSYRVTCQDNNGRYNGSLNQPRNTVAALEAPIKAMCPEVPL
jgi:hypothetical protein